MSYAKRFERMRQAHSRSREHATQDGAVGEHETLCDTIHVGSAPRVRGGEAARTETLEGGVVTPQQQAQKGKTDERRRAQPSERRDDAGGANRDKYFKRAAHDANVAEEGVAEMATTGRENILSADASVSPPPAHADLRRSATANGREEIIVSVSEADHDHHHQQQQHDHESAMSEDTQKTASSAREAPVREEAAGDAEEGRAASFAGRESAERDATPQRLSTTSSSQRQHRHPRHRGRSGSDMPPSLASNSRPSTPHKSPANPIAFSVSAKKPQPQPMPLKAESRKHFESPRALWMRSSSGSHEAATPSPSAASHGKPASEDRPAPQRAARTNGHGATSGREACTPRSVGSAASSGGADRRSVESEVLQARLHAVAQARTEVERVLQNQSQYEEEIMHILAKLEQECRQQQEELLLPLHSSEKADGGVDGAVAGHTDEGLVDSKRDMAASMPASGVKAALRQAERERDVALRLLRQFKDEGNAVVQRLYDAVKAQEKENVRLLAAQEALQRENKQLRRLFTTSTSKAREDRSSESVGEDGKPILHLDDLTPRADTDGDGEMGNAKTREPTDSELALQAQVREQQVAIAELGQLLQAADRTMGALRRRVEVAEAQKQALLLQAASSSLSFLGFTTRSGRGKAKATAKQQKGNDTAAAATAAAAVEGARKGGEGEEGKEEVEEEAEEDSPPTPIQRLLERHPQDADVANMKDLLLAARSRIRELQASLHHERAERLQAELTAQAMAAENEKNVKLLEERLQRAEVPRGLTVPSALRDAEHQGGEAGRSRPHGEEEEGEERESPSAEASRLEALAAMAPATPTTPVAASRPPPPPPPPPVSAQTGTDAAATEESSDTSPHSSTNNRQLRTTWSDAADLTAGRASAKGGAGDQDNSASHTVKEQPREENAVAEEEGERDPATQEEQTDETTATSPTEGRHHHKPKRKRRTNKSRHGADADDATATSSAPPRSPRALPVGKEGVVKDSAMSPSQAPLPPPLPPSSSAAAKPPKPVVKAYIGQRTAAPDRDGEGDGGVVIRVPLSIPPPTPNASFSRQSAHNGNDSPVESRASRASSSSRRMVLSLTPRGNGNEDAM